MNSAAAKREIVLLGDGPAHLYVLKMWREAPLPHTRLTCVSDFFSSIYCRMLPGTLEGSYPPDRMQIELVRLCQAAGVRLIRAAISGLDLAARQLHCEGGPPIPFDILSIDLRRVPSAKGIEMDETAVPLEPMQTFLPRLDQRLQTLTGQFHDRPLKIAVIGGGAVGVEVALCLPNHLNRLLPSHAWEMAILAFGSRLADDRPRRVGLLAQRELQRRQVDVLLNRSVVRVAEGEIVLDSGESMPADFAIWATDAQAPPLVEKLGLPTNEQGLLRTYATLQSTGDPNILVVGDIGAIDGQPAPKAGTFTVGQGPILWGNLHRLVYHRPMLRYRLQRRSWSLMATGDGRAILCYHRLALHAHWCGWLKDHIDARFVDQFTA